MLTTNRASCIQSLIRRSVATQTRGVTSPLDSSVVWPHLE